MKTLLKPYLEMTQIKKINNLMNLILMIQKTMKSPILRQRKTKTKKIMKFLIPMNKGKTMIKTIIQKIKKTTVHMIALLKKRIKNQKKIKSQKKIKTMVQKKILKKKKNL